MKNPWPPASADIEAVRPTTIAQAIRQGAERLRCVADNPRLEARLLLAYALGVTQNDLIGNADRLIQSTTFDGLITRRIAHEPVALIIGQREFWSMSFQVSRDTLLPRPDTETLIEAALLAFRDRPPPRTIIDLGTGTGCLLLALLSEFRKAYGIGIDLSPAATRLARGNANRFGLISRAGFLAGNWTDSIVGRFDLLISNPPYIKHDDIQTLMPEVNQYEPSLALDGGVDGYDAYRMIVPRLHHLLEPSGVAILELGCGQATYVTALAREAGLEVSLQLDLAEIPRAIVLTWPDSKRNCLAGA